MLLRVRQQQRIDAAAAAAAARRSPAPAISGRRLRGLCSKHVRRIYLCQAAAETAAESPAAAARRRKQPSEADREIAAETLVTSCGLSPQAAARIAAAAAGAGAPIALPHELAARVSSLQDALGGAAAAERAVRAFPPLLACKPGRVAERLALWSDAFPTAPPAALRARLAARPQLLALEAERAVPALFEMAALAGVDRAGWAAWAYRSLALASIAPATFEARLHAMARLLNDGPLNSSGSDATSNTTTSSSSSSGGGGPFAFVDVQRAAQRDHRWLMLSEALAAERLAALAAALDVDWRPACRAFLRQPSLLIKRPALLAERAAALAALPGLGVERARGAVAAMPALLNLKPDAVAARWRVLQQAAAGREAWARALDAAAPATLASVLVRSDARLRRLEYLGGASARDLPAGSFKAAVEADAGRFNTRFPGFGEWLREGQGGSAADDENDDDSAAAASTG